MTTLDVDPGRASRAAEALQAGTVEVEEGKGRDAFRVRSFSRDRVYRVRLGPSPSCDCPDAAYRGTTLCKHVIACAILRGTERADQ